MRPLILLTMLSGLLMTASLTQAADCPVLLQHTMRQLHTDNDINLCERFAGKPLLIVNTASHCGFTPQFEGLEALYHRYKEAGVEFIGVASDSFFQEADDEEETASVCFENYGVTFTMLAPVPVRGGKAHPLFKELAAQSESPSWNFNKYVVDAEGKVVAHFGSRTKPDDKQITELLDQLSKAPR